MKGSKLPENGPAVLQPPHSTRASRLFLEKSRSSSMEDDVVATLPKTNTKVLDEFGFIVNIDDSGALRDENSVSMPGGANTPSALTPTKMKNLSRREKRQGMQIMARREAKWRDMFLNWNTVSTAKQKKHILRSRVRKGIPNSVRGEAWLRLARVHYLIRRDQVGVYADLVMKSFETIEDNHESKDALQPSVEVTTNEGSVTVSLPDAQVAVESTRSENDIMKDTIERDLYRTFPRHSMFYDEENSEDESSNDNDSSFDKVSELGSFVESIENGDMGESVHTNANLRKKEGMCFEVYKDDALELDIRNKSSNDENATKIEKSKFWNGSIKLLENARSGCSPIPFTLEMHEDPIIDAVVIDEPIPPPIPRESVNAAPLKKKEKVQTDYAVAEGGQAKLRRVLRAYGTYDPEVGYCQGMNFIAAMFITFVSEEEAFWLLVKVMNSGPCRMRGLFLDGMSEAHQVLYVAERLIEKFLPRLHRHFVKENIHITMFATQWLLTMFTSSFPFDVVTRVWDSFLLEGWKVSYRVMLALLEKEQSKLLKMNFEVMMNHFKEIPYRVTVNDLFESAFKIKLKSGQVNKYAREWEQKQINKKN